MTTYTFGHDPNHFVEVPDETYVDPLQLGRTRTARPAAGFTVLVRNFLTDADLNPITTVAYGYFQTYTTSDVPAIKVSTDGWASYKVLVAEEFLQAASLVPVAQINATGTRSSSTFLRGDGTWSTPPGSSITASSITDASTIGKSILTAADAAAVRSAAGSLAASAVSTFALTLLDDASAAAARTTLGALGTTDVPAFDLVSTPSGGDVWTWDIDSNAYVPKAPNIPPADTWAVRGATVNPGDPVPTDFPVGGWLAVRATAPVLGATAIGSNGSASSTSSVSVNLTGSVTTTDDIMVVISGAAPGTVFSTVTITDTASTSYALRGQRLQGSTLQVQVFKGRPTASISLASTLTVSLGAAISDLEVQVIKLTGLQSSAFDQQALNSGNGVTSLALATGTPTAQANELAIAVVGFNQASNAVTPSAGWTQIGSTQTSGGSSPRYVATFMKQLTAIGTTSFTATLSTSCIAAGVLDTFKAV